jgi:anti-sigma regulatory factor (Ser/Thr protein kinase)
VAPRRYTARFTVDDLPQLRHAVADWAARTGLLGQRAADFVIAVHEIATNAVRHGSPVARLDLHSAGTVAQAEIRDSGHWPPGPAAAAAPGGLGLGLYVARRVCDEVIIRRGASGSTVILQMSLPGHDTTPPADRALPKDGTDRTPKDTP